MTRKFYGCVKQLWNDKLGQISLAVTTLFWGAGASLQFIVLKWAESALGLPLDKGAILQGVCAFLLPSTSSKQFLNISQF